jgi:glyoxalase family protein
MNDPDGHLVELATAGPGFAIDEPVTDLGRDLKLPPWLEGKRGVIERELHPVTAPQWHPLEAR